MANKYDYYELLGVVRSASQAEIRVAYRKLARQYHPDVNANQEAEERFKQLNEAYEVLSNQEKRALYDLYSHAGLSLGLAGAEDEAGKILQQFLKQYVRQNSDLSGKRAGSDLQSSMTITFEQAVRGAQINIEFQRYEQCKKCYGTGLNTPVPCMRCAGSGKISSVNKGHTVMSPCTSCRGFGQVVRGSCHVCYGERRQRVFRKLKVNIPAGIDDRMRIRLDKEGDEGLAGGPPGDLYVEVHVRAHKYLRRDGQNIVFDLHLNMAQVILGDEIEVPTADGMYRLTIQPGIQTGQTFRLAGKGVPDVYQQKEQGDMIITVSVQAPTELTRAQRELIQAYFGSSSRGSSATAHHEHVLDLHLRLSAENQGVKMELIVQDKALQIPLAISADEMAHLSAYLKQDTQIKQMAETISGAIESGVQHLGALDKAEHPIFNQLLSKLHRRQSEKEPRSQTQ